MDIADPDIPVPALADADAVTAPTTSGLDKIAETQSQEKAAALTPHRPARTRNPGDIALRILTLAAAILILVTAAGLVVVLLKNAWPAMTHFGWDYFTLPQADLFSFSAEAAILGTLYSSILAVLIAGPIGVLIAVFLSEIAGPRLKLPLGFLVEMLAAIPSIVYGLWGFYVLVPFIGIHVAPFLTSHFGGTPFFKGGVYSTGLGMISAVAVLSIMILPTVAAISRDVISAVPRAQREAMLALGATRWETTWKVVVPYARAGIVGGIILGLARALGETMAVTMVIGSSETPFSLNLLQPATTIPVTLVNQLNDASAEMYRSALLELALLLMLITMGLNLFARLMVWTVDRKYSS